MPTLMEKKDWIQTVANMGTASGVWSENVTGDAGLSSIMLPESGSYQVILVKIGETKIDTERANSVTVDICGSGVSFHESCQALDLMCGRPNTSSDGTPPTKRLKIGSMKDEIQLPENFDQEFEALDDQVASLFVGSVS